MTYDATKLHEAVCAIAARCDGAQQEDSIGFSGQDTLFGRRVAQCFTAKDYDDDLSGEVYRMLRKYTGQLERYGAPYEAIPVPPVIYEANSASARDKARQAERQAKNTVSVSMSGADVVFTGKGTFDIKDQLRTAGARWDAGTKTWRGPVALGMLKTLLLANRWTVDEDAERLLEGVEEAPIEDLKPRPEKVVSVIPGTDQAIVAWCNVERAEFNEILSSIRSLPDIERSYKAAQKVWQCKITDQFLAVCKTLKFDGIAALEEALAHTSANREAAAKTQALALVASRAEDTEAKVAIESDLYAFQRAGVDYVVNLAKGRCIIGDEQGLGKTRQGLSAIETANAYPAVIVCPSKLKLNWQKEIKALLPHRTVEVVSGNRTHEPRADITIVNYDIMEAWAPKLNPIGLVLDESHYIKNYKAKRTKAVLDLSKRMQERGVRCPDLVCTIIELSGTPVVNRPVELVTQIEMIGMMHLFGSRARYLRRYCYIDDGSQYANYNGASHMMELNEILRSNCYVRREKAYVLKDLPAKQIAPQWIELPKAFQAEYALVKENLVKFLIESKSKTSEEARRALQAETLVKINSLRHLVGQAKVEHAIEWITEFLDSTDRQLVVFATHIDVQNALYERLTALGISTARIQGGVKDTVVEAEKERFQAGDAKVIVCSLVAGGVGHTLTAASDVLMVEQGWTPASHDQALDRVHRIGQTEQVTGHFILVDDTIDQWIFGLINDKRQVVRAVTSGDEADEQESMFNLIVSMFLE